MGGSDLLHAPQESLRPIITHPKTQKIVDHLRIEISRWTRKDQQRAHLRRKEKHTPDLGCVKRFDPERIPRQKHLPPNSIQ